jgi:hypothetical protein
MFSIYQARSHQPVTRIQIPNTAESKLHLQKQTNKINFTTNYLLQKAVVR